MAEAGRGAAIPRGERGDGIETVGVDVHQPPPGVGAGAVEQDQRVRDHGQRVQRWEQDEEYRAPANERDFAKSAPKFVLGYEAWDLFISRFENMATSWHIGHQCFKMVLFQSLEREAFALACPVFKPTQPPYDVMTGEQYAKALQELFEPAAESESMQLEFLQRTQAVGEQPERYFRDKVRMFLRGYPRAQRDYNYLYRELTSGLLNEEMKYRMRGYRPRNPQDLEEYCQELIHWATVQRVRYMAGDIAQGETLGAEARTADISYRAYANNEMMMRNPVKNEIMTMDRVNAFRRNNRRFNRDPKDGMCWHCGQKDHIMANCPRKLTGLPAAAAMGQERKDRVATGNTGNSGGRRKPGPGMKTRPVNKPGALTQGNTNRRFKRRILHVFEDEDGNLYDEVPDLIEEDSDGECEDEEGENDQGGTQGDGQAEEVTQGVHAMELGVRQVEDCTETDFIPGAFLGL